MTFKFAKIAAMGGYLEASAEIAIPIWAIVGMICEIDRPKKGMASCTAWKPPGIEPRFFPKTSSEDMAGPVDLLRLAKARAVSLVLRLKIVNMPPTTGNVLASKPKAPTTNSINTLRSFRNTPNWNSGPKA